MQIYVVKPSDTLFKIAKTYNVSVESIVAANELPNPDLLLVGQALVIPIEGSYYTVRRGDSLWLIGRMFGLSYTELARLNKLNVNQPIYIGQQIYIPPREKTNAVANAYAEPPASGAGEALLRDTEKAAPTLTYITAFSYQANRDGTISDLNISGIDTIAADNGNKLMMAVTNIENGEFSASLARDILQSKAVQELLLDNIISKAKSIEGVSDVHFDFEYIPADLKTAYTAFITRAAERLHAEGFMISVALAPKTSATQTGQWYEAHDYRALGAVADFVVIMTYEWGYSAGPPMAVSPIGPVERVLRYAVTEMPAGKILMGQNLYGYDWTLPYIAGERYARALSPQAALEIGRQHLVSISYDYVSQAPYFYYNDNEGNRHVIWFEDARSIQAKFNVLRAMNLRGISYWKLGLPFPQNWLLLSDNFNIVKY